MFEILLSSMWKDKIVMVGNEMKQSFGPKTPINFFTLDFVFKSEQRFVGQQGINIVKCKKDF